MPTVFISHASADADIAAVFKTDVESAFLGMCTLFVSSNLDSISAGQQWFDTIGSNLADSTILVGLLSPVAMQRPWVYFEFGAAWIRQIPAIPMCLGGISPSNLVPPLSMFQGLQLSDPIHLKHLYEKIAESIPCKTPNADFAELSSKYFEITETFRKQALLKNWVVQLIRWNPDLEKLFTLETEETQIHVPAQSETVFFEFIQVASQQKFLQINPAGMAIGTPVGIQAALFSLKRGTLFETVWKTLDLSVG